MIGYRGCYRYVREPELFALELAALARVREETANLHIMIPFVRTKWELARCLELIDASPLGRQRGLLRWVMADARDLDETMIMTRVLVAYATKMGSTRQIAETRPTSGRRRSLVHCTARKAMK